MISSNYPCGVVDRDLERRVASAPPARSLSASSPAMSSRYRAGQGRQTLAQETPSDMPDKACRAEWKYSDCHFHPTNYIQQGHKPASLIAEMDALGIEYATLMPIPTNVLSSQSDPDWDPCKGERHCGPDYYLPTQIMAKRTIGSEDIRVARAATELYVNTGVDATTATLYLQLPQAQRRRLDPMITGLHLGDMHSSSYLLQKLAQHPGVFTGVGEITVHKEVVQDLFAGNRQADLEGNVEPLLKLLKTCGEIGMPVVLHCDVDLPSLQDNDAPAYLQGIRRLFLQPDVANTSIVWAHAGGLGRFVNAPANHVATLRQMLEDKAMRHVHVDLSWGVVAERLTQSPQTQAEWTALIVDHPQRFLFGSDALAPADRDAWNKTYASYASLLASLPDGVRHQVLRGNYERVFVRARSRVRAFEKFLLADALRESAGAAQAGARPEAATVTTTTATGAQPFTPRDMPNAADAAQPRVLGSPGAARQ